MWGPARASDAGVGDHDVQPAELREPLVDNLVDRRLVAHIGSGCHNPTAQRLDFFDGLGEFLLGSQLVGEPVDLLADVERDDVGTVPGKPHRMGAALAARPTADEGNLAVQRSHADLPFSGVAAPHSCI